jgi:hypothetical protein
MSISRRAFLAHLAAYFGAMSVTDLSARVADLGRPLLLAPQGAERTIHVYEGGLLTLGSLDQYDDDAVPTWRALIEAEGVNVRDPAVLALELAYRGMSEGELDEVVSDVCWPMAEAMVWNPAARASRLLRDLKVGSCLRGKEGRLGRLNFHEGDNHPGSSDMWVEARDDLSVSLLQARLIELRQPIRLVMEVSTILPLE